MASSLGQHWHLETDFSAWRERDFLDAATLEGGKSWRAGEAKGWAFLHPTRAGGYRVIQQAIIPDGARGLFGASPQGTASVRGCVDGEEELPRFWLLQWSSSNEERRVWGAELESNC
ncbi:acriflavin resistance protein [Marssonina coronariae]|uniref:Acriflavin resistance protein n=1 Tax=Diplocarpon coronariae TaxID=2795749 RepID=A0A218ZHD7_9HELO|nr:acriflavin resistance protein [Marssonina coronariae]